MQLTGWHSGNDTRNEICVDTQALSGYDAVLHVIHCKQVHIGIHCEHSLGIVSTDCISDNNLTDSLP